MKNGKICCSTPKKSLRENFNYQPPKVWVSGFPCVDGNSKLVSAIKENGKNGHSTPKMHPRAKLPIIDPPLKFGSLVFRVLTETQNWCIPLQKKGKIAVAPPKMCPRVKLPITNPPKVWVSGFPTVDGNGKLVSANTENGKSGHSSPKTHPRAKLPVIDPPKVWVCEFSKCQWKCKICVGHY